MGTKPLTCIPGEIGADMDQGALIVGRPKKDAKKAEPLKAKTVGIRATGEWAAWLEEAARYDRVDIAKFLDKAAAEYAKSIGFKKAPPERIP